MQSIDPDCLSMLAFLRFTRAPVVVKEVKSLGWKTCRDLNINALPVMIIQHEDDAPISISGTRNILNYLQEECGYNLDASLSVRQRAEVEAFRTWFETDLRDAVWWNWVVNKVNFPLVRPDYTSCVPFSLFYLPKQLFTLARARSQERGWYKPDIQSDVLFTATQIIATVSKRLSSHSGQYLYGNEPTSIDCTLFGYLSACLYPELTDAAMQEAVGAYPNVVSYIDAITDMLSDDEVVTMDQGVGEADMDVVDHTEYTDVPSSSSQPIDMESTVRTSSIIKSRKSPLRFTPKRGIDDPSYYDDLGASGYQETKRWDKAPDSGLLSSVFSVIKSNQIFLACSGLLILAYIGVSRSRR